MTFRATIAKIHKWASLGMATLWLLQAITGLLIVFHWEIDDLTVKGAHHPTNLAAIDATARTVAPAGSGLTVGSIWNTAGQPDRYDLFVEGDRGKTITVDGAGNILRVRMDGESWRDGGWIETLVSFHHNLLADDFGSWIVGISGCLLLSNIAMGLAIAWPRRGTWGKSLRPSSRGPAAARRYSWHRALGLWAAVPALFSVTAGTLIVFADGVESLLAPAPWSIDDRPSTEPAKIAMPDAARAALSLYPEARISGIRYPSPDNAVYRFRLRQPSEDARAYGQTTVFVDAGTGAIVGNFDALSAPPARRVTNGLFAFHTGEFGGPLGRIAVFMIGLWLISMIVLGLGLWNARRKRS